VSELPDPVARVSAFLRESGAEARVQEFPDGTHTAQDAADAVGCELAQIVKSLVFVCDGQPVVALVPGDRRGDPAKVAAAYAVERTRLPGRGVISMLLDLPIAVSPEDHQAYPGIPHPVSLSGGMSRVSRSRIASRAALNSAAGSPDPATATGML